MCARYFILYFIFFLAFVSLKFLLVQFVFLPFYCDSLHKINTHTVIEKANFTNKNKQNKAFLSRKRLYSPYAVIRLQYSLCVATQYSPFSGQDATPSAETSQSEGNPPTAVYSIVFRVE